MTTSRRVPCLRCGNVGPWRRDAYASSKAMTEMGKVCPLCAKLMREEAERQRQPRVYAKGRLKGDRIGFEDLPPWFYEQARRETAP